MFENFSKFFAEKKNTHIFIAALVILGGIFTLKRVGLYEGMVPEIDTSSATEVTKTPGTVKRQ
jgi:multidrug efflux pump subunit AcrB